jgi:hypothetical protein
MHLVHTRLPYSTVPAACCALAVLQACQGAHAQWAPRLQTADQLWVGQRQAHSSSSSSSQEVPAWVPHWG